MFKVITAEIKKSLSKPGIYVLAVILALSLVLGVFIYKPESIESTNSKINETTYTGKYSLFYEENVGIKDVIDSKIQDITFAVSSYQEIVDSKLVSKQSYINTLFNIVKSNFYEYRNCAADNSYEAIIEKSRNNLIDSINELDSAIVTAISATTKNSYALLKLTMIIVKL